MASNPSLAVPGIAAFLRTVSNEPVETTIEYLILLLKGRQIKGSKQCALATAYVLRRAISLTRNADSEKLLRRVREVGKRLIEVAPRELAIGNIVRRVLGLIRDEEDEQRGDDGSGMGSDLGSRPSTPRTDGSHPPPMSGANGISPPRDPASSQRPPLLSSHTGAATPGVRPFTSMFSIISHPTMRAGTDSPTLRSGQATPQLGAQSTDLRAEVLEGMSEIIDELDQADDQIANYSLEHIYPTETIFTYASSLTVQRFLLKAASKRKFTVIHAESYPNDHRKSHAIVTGNHDVGEDEDLGLESFQKPLVQAGIQVILIPDSAMFTLVSRCSKVVLSASTVLANGSFTAAAGSKSVVKAARFHRVPVLVLAATYQLSSEYPYDPYDLVDYGDMGKVIQMQDGELRRGLKVRNPLNDMVTGGDVDLFVTNLGGVTGSMIYRLTRDQYREEDLTL